MTTDVRDQFDRTAAGYSVSRAGRFFVLLTGNRVEWVAGCRFLGRGWRRLNWRAGSAVTPHANAIHMCGSPPEPVAV